MLEQVYLLLLPLNLKIKTDEVIEDCLKSKDFPKDLEDLLELMDSIKNNDHFFDDYMRCLSLDISILRRFATSSIFRNKTVSVYMKHITKIPRIYENEINNSSDKVSFLFKEVAALIGVISLDSNFLEYF